MRAHFRAKKINLRSINHFSVSNVVKSKFTSGGNEIKNTECQAIQDHWQRAQTWERQYAALSPAMPEPTRLLTREAPVGTDVLGNFPGNILSF